MIVGIASPKEQITLNAQQVALSEKTLTGSYYGSARPAQDFPRLMSFLGLVPSEYSSGQSRSLGGITKAGNSHARRILIEAAWSYRHPPRIARGKQIRQEDRPRAVREIAWRAQLRLCQRYTRLSARGMHQNQTCVSIARELAGFMWDIARQVANS